MNFKQFLFTLKDESSPAGDIARDFIASKSKAQTCKGVKKSIEKHITLSGNVLEAFENAVERYKEINKN